MTRQLGYALLVTSALVAASGAQAQQGYHTRYFGFGDSLTDNGRIPRESNGFSPPENLQSAFGTRVYERGLWSNGPVFFEVVPRLIGTPYDANADFAVGGAESVRQAPTPLNSPTFAWGLPDQVDQALARFGRFGPRDLLNVWIGYNDITPVQFGSDQQKAETVTAIVGNTVTAINRLAGAGGRTFVVFNQRVDRFEANLGGFRVPLAGNDVALAVNGVLPGALAPLSAAGLNIHYFDVATLIDRLRANPTAFGFGADANTPCSSVPACAARGIDNNGALANQHISPDGIHSSGRTNQIIAAFLANQINAPLTIGPQGELGQSAGLAFSSTLIDFLSAERRRNMAMSVPATYAADLPGRPAPPVMIPVQVGSPLSVFALGTYLNVDRTAQNRSGGSLGNSFSADFGGVTAGILYQATPNLVLGAAFNYLNTSVDLRGPTNGRIDMDSVQGAGFASLSFPDVFADAVVTYGRNIFTLDRPGAMGDRLSAAPSGETVTAAGRVGYLFDFGSFKVGPVGEVAYAHVSVDAYRERGDMLLAIGTQRQDLEGLSAGGGVQIRSTLPLWGGLASPFVTVTAQHDVLNGVRTVTSFQTYAPNLLIRTETGRQGNDVYGRLAGGLNLDLGNGLSGVLTGSTSFARSGGDDATLSAGLRYRF
ncbi:autotransporter domain-containing protein [Methylobacterium sp. 88A]|uniref:autotransporter domain-containing protein n=1 Tax=Methylobacterium sp. 88A TaxID=1131813 RepID=UPI0009DAE6B0|nr:autotransporter domain-containing protein [Methylobacterium sp. 88A]